MRSIPLVSVVIPTYGRPQFLRRAINSAFLAAPDNDVEVVIVPNGPDDAWKVVADSYSGDARVRWKQSSVAQANHARNIGLSAARGKYVRFLDDDDYLLTAACEQCLFIEKEQSDVCQAAIDLVDDGGNVFEQWRPLLERDYATSMLGDRRITHNCSFLYRTEKIMPCRWDESRHNMQDVAWAIGLIGQNLDFCVLDQSVGVWFHHGLSRISSGMTWDQRNRETVSILFDALARLKHDQALCERRAQAACDGIWQCIHRSFFWSPIYWGKVLRETQCHFPASLPPTHFYQRSALKRIDPLFLEWVMTPHRYIKNMYIEWLRRRGVIDPW